MHLVCTLLIREAPLFAESALLFWFGLPEQLLIPDLSLNLRGRASGDVSEEADGNCVTRALHRAYHTAGGLCMACSLGIYTCWCGLQWFLPLSLYIYIPHSVKRTVP